MPQMETVHISVLLQETLRWLNPRSDGLYIDATFGGGGHTAALLKASAPNGRVIAVDADKTALQRGERRFVAEIATGRLTLLHGNFRSLGSLLPPETAAQGILLDIGLSSDQLSDAERGFAFQTEAPLDMRFDPLAGPSAAELLTELSEEEIADILFTYGEERHARAIAKRIVQFRAEHPVTSTGDLVKIVISVLPRRHDEKIHPATRTFQALRIAVNGELSALRDALPQALNALTAGGRIVVISFHSLEDRIVKEWMRDEAKNCICPPSVPVCVCGHTARLKIVTKRPETASNEETSFNPRARSAKLRAAERI